MTYPIPDPGPVTGDPRRTYPVPLKSCCGLMAGDDCDCLAELLEALTAPCIGPVVAWRAMEVTR